MRIRVQQQRGVFALVLLALAAALAGLVPRVSPAAERAQATVVVAPPAGAHPGAATRAPPAG